MQPYFLGGGSTASRLSMRSMDSIALGNFGYNGSDGIQVL